MNNVGAGLPPECRSQELRGNCPAHQRFLHLASNLIGETNKAENEVSGRCPRGGGCNVKKQGVRWEGREEEDCTRISLPLKRPAHQEGETEGSELDGFRKQRRD